MPNKKQQQMQHYHDRPWTIARCNLLIRRLSQSIEELRKIGPRPPTISESTEPADRPRSENALKRKADSNHETDPIWAIRSSTKKRRFERTYSDRGSQKGHNGRDRVSNHYCPTSSNVHCSRDLDERNARIKRSRQWHLHKIEAGKAVADALDETFMQTTPHGRLHDGRRNEPATIRGSGSLVDMCLRKIPDTILLEEDLRKEEDPDDKSDVASEVMQLLLEHPFAGYPKGCQLAEVTRARAMTLLQQTLRSGAFADFNWGQLNCVFNLHNRLLDHESAHRALHDYYQLQFRSKSYREGYLGQRALPSLLEHHSWRLILGPSCSGELFLEDMGNSFYRQFKVEYDNNSREWYLRLGRTQALFISVRRIATEDAPVEISHFALHILERALMVTSEARDECDEGQHSRMINKILVSLVVGAVTSQRKLPAVWPIRVAAESVHATSIHLHVLASLLILTANLLLSTAYIYTTAGSAKQTLDHFCRFIRLANDAELSTAASLLCLVTQELDTTSSFSQRVGFELFRRTLESLLSWQGPSDAETSKSKFALRRLVLTAAVANAGLPTSTAEDRVFAQDIENRITALKRSSDGSTVAEISPYKPATHRWEEGMCEWIAITPAPRPKRGPSLGRNAGRLADAPNTASADSGRDDSDSDDDAPATSPLSCIVALKMPEHAAPRGPSQRISLGLQLDGTSDDFDGLPSPPHSKGPEHRHLSRSM